MHTKNGRVELGVTLDENGKTAVKVDSAGEPTSRPEPAPSPMEKLKTAMLQETETKP